jgi:RNA polymerase sigma factor (sigma-70 family)
VDQLLLPYLQASDESERQQRLDELLMVHAVPVVRQALRRRLGFYVDQRGINAHNQDAEDLYQEVMTKVVQALHDLRNPSAKTDIQNLKQYVARIASNACNDVLRTKSPARARLKNNLRFLLTNHRDFAVWTMEGETLSGFAVWRDTSKSLSSQRELFNIEERLPDFPSARFGNENIKKVPLTKIVAELLQWTGSPIELDVLVNVVATLLDVKDHQVESLDDQMADLETRIADNTLQADSRLEEKALLRNLWQALGELSAEQRDVFCFGFEDQSGRDLFTVLLEAEVVTFRELAQQLDRSTEKIIGLWSNLPMDDETIAVELKTTRAQVYKWRFRALQRLKKGLLPFSSEK